MKILISNLPKHKWWGHGTPIYKDNPAMKQGMIPNQELVEVEMHMLTQLFNRLPVEVIEVDFPNFLDQQNTEKRKHDFHHFGPQGTHSQILFPPKDRLYLKDDRLWLLL